MHESSEEFEIRRDPTTDRGVSSPLASEKIPIDLSDKGSLTRINYPKLYSLAHIPTFL